MEENEELSKLNKEFLKSLKAERPTYKDMVDFCASDMILNNNLCVELINHGICFNEYCGDQFEYFDDEGNQITESEYFNLDGNGDEQLKDIYQYYIISSDSAERFAEYTNEIVIYNEELDLYLLCVTHWGTPWEGVSANWKDF